MEKCIQTRKHKYTFTISIYSWQCNYSKKRLLFNRLENSANTTDMVDQKRGRQSFAKRTTSYLLLFQGSPLVLAAISRQHRHCRSSLQQVVPKSEVTEYHQETGTDNTEDTELHAPAHFSGLRFGTSHESGIKIKQAQYSYSLPKRPKLRSLLANQNDKNSLQKTHWRSSTSSRKVWWLDDGGSQCPQWGGWITKQSQVHCRGIRSSHSMHSILSVQNKDFTWDGEEFVKIHGVVTQTKSWTHRQLDGVWESMSPHFNTSSIRYKWHRWKSRSTSKGRYVSSIAAIRIGWNVVVWLYGILLQSATRSRPPGREENSVWKTIWRSIQRANNSFWSNGWISSNQTRIHQIGKKVSPDIFLGYEMIAGRIWKGDILIADLEDLEKLDASEIYQQRLIAKEVRISQTGNEFIFPVADGTAKLPGRNHEFREPTVRREQTVRSEDFSEQLQGEPGESQPTESRDDAEARADFLSIQGDVIYRHHNEPWVHLYVPKDETFPIPLRYIDVTRCTHIDLDVLQEKRIDDYWNVDASKHLSDSWKGFTKFTLLKEKPPKGYMWSGKRKTKVQTTTRPDHVWPEVWTKKWNAAQNREKHEWKKRGAKTRQCSTTERNSLYWPGWPRLQRNSRHAVQKESSDKHHEGGCGGNCITKSSKNDLWLYNGISWILKATSGIFSSYKTRRSHCRQKVSLRWPKTIWFTILFLCRRRLKSRMQKPQWTRNGTKLETTPAWQLEKVKSKKEVVLEAQRDHFATLMDIGHLKNVELEPKLQKYKGRVVLRGDIVKDDSGAYAAFTEQGSSASQMTAAKKWWMLLQDYQFVMDEQLMQYQPTLK